MHITALRIETGDLAAQRAFYTGVLGLPLRHDAPNTFTVAAGDTLLTFDGVAGSTATYHVAFTIPENKLAAAKVWLRDRATLHTLDGADEFPSQSWNATMLYFRDPAGTILEFIARHALPNAAPGTFTPHDLLCVSEIGLPVDDVPAAIATLTAALGILPYRGGEADTFAPLGDEDGLFIVVRRGRHWFPTDTPSVAAPIALTVRGVAHASRSFSLPGLPYTITIPA